MNWHRTLFWAAAALVLLGTSFASSAQEMKVDGKALVRGVHGTVQYSEQDKWLDVKPGRGLVPGTILRTGADSCVEVYVNQASTIQLAPETTVEFQKMI
jgi:hypothetical protein